MKVGVLGLLAWFATRTASAESLDAVVRARLVVPAGIGIVTVHDTLDVSAETVALEAPRDIRVGRQSIRVYIKGKSRWVPVTFGKLVKVALATHALAPNATIEAADFEIVERAGTAAPGDLTGATVVRAIAAHAAIAAQDVAMPAPQARGTQVSVEVHRGRVRVKGSGTLELAARVGQPATVRLASSNAIVHGTLVAVGSVVVGQD
ncbi:MAG: flagella basal body P-ring formation protein FlgA [Proteobacteria bacterium]|nr:flagella basal body P-ring formation protein FlgA [Pseudomonadota bacterium]